MFRRLIAGALFALASLVAAPLAGAAAQGTGGSVPPTPTDSQQVDPAVGNAPTGVNAGGGGAASGSDNNTLPLVAMTGALAAVAVVVVARNRTHASVTRS